MNIGNRITELRKRNSWSQSDLASKIDISQVMVGKYERNDAVPSIEVAKKIADAFNVSLDYLVGDGVNVTFDKKTVERLKDITLLDDETKNMLFKLIDTTIRDSKTRKAYS